jgi:hypothetical protein
VKGELRIREDNIKVLLKIRDVEAEDWVKLPQRRRSVRIACEHGVQPDFR